MTDVADLFARNLRAERSRLRMTQAELADAIGWARPTVSAMEAGRRQVTVADLAPLCRALGVPLRKLFEGIDPDDVRALGL